MARDWTKSSRISGTGRSSGMKNTGPNTPSRAWTERLCWTRRRSEITWRSKAARAGSTARPGRWVSSPATISRAATDICTWPIAASEGSRRKTCCSARPTGSARGESSDARDAFSRAVRRDRSDGRGVLRQLPGVDGDRASGILPGEWGSLRGPGIGGWNPAGGGGGRVPVLASGALRRRDCRGDVDRAVESQNGGVRLFDPECGDGRHAGYRRDQAYFSGCGDAAGETAGEIFRVFWDQFFSDPNLMVDSPVNLW